MDRKKHTSQFQLQALILIGHIWKDSFEQKEGGTGEGQLLIFRRPYLYWGGGKGVRRGQLKGMQHGWVKHLILLPLKIGI